MRINETAVFQIRVNGSRKNPDEIEIFSRENDERDDDAKKYRARDPEETLPQLLEMVEERHLRFGRDTFLSHVLSHHAQPLTRKLGLIRRGILVDQFIIDT